MKFTALILVSSEFGSETREILVGEASSSTEARNFVFSKFGYGVTIVRLTNRELGRAELTAWQRWGKTRAA